ncbi:molecular chaperone [Dyella sp.]|uniref:fimbrial biogenesis chaperone n=1 Tax=Dyella sp. TaxID=1869338 RepID=UPI002ED189DA
MHVLRLLPVIGLLASLALASGTAAASGLQVSPVQLTLQASQNADGLWLSNTTADPLHAQVRVFKWTQEGGEDKLEPSRDLVISPPMVQLAGNDHQLVRAIRVGAPPAAGQPEASYRVIIDELPVGTDGKKGLQFVLRYSVPIYVEPAGGAATSSQLQWSMRSDGDHAVLEVKNSGTAHAQLSAISFTDKAGHRTEINSGLFGYVLPGATVHWTLKHPLAMFANGGTIEGTVNGEKASQAISLATR